MKWKQYASLAIGRLCGVGPFAIALVICTQMCSAQQLSIVAVRAELEKKMVTIRGTKLSFADALAQVGKQTGHSVIADDQPHLQSAELDLHGTAVQALDRIADIFDYTWMVSKKGVILLTKRFKTKLEYPQVDPPELYAAIKDGLTAIKTISDLDEVISSDEWMDRIYQEFTPEQKVLLKTGAVQPASMLSTHQAQLIDQAALHIYFAGVIGTWKFLALQFEKMPRAFFQLRDLPGFYVRRGDIQMQPGLPTGRQVDYVLVLDGKEDLLGFDWLPAKKEEKKSDGK